MFLARKSWWGARPNPLDVLLLTDRNERVINKNEIINHHFYTIFSYLLVDVHVESSI